MGAGVGSSDGTSVGTGVGSSDGTSVGTGMGSSDGSWQLSTSFSD